MREYELIYVVQPDLDEVTLVSVIERVNDLIKTSNGEIIKTERWGKRKLAYPVRKLNEGFYIFSSMKLDPSASIELKRNIKFIEQIIRLSIILSK